MLSAGPDSHVLERLSPRFKKLGGRVGVALQGIVEILRGDQLPRVRLHANGISGEMGWVIVGNSRCYGGHFAATPGADPFRGDFEVVSQRTAGRGAAAAFLLGIPNGRHLRRSDVTHVIVDRVRLEAVDEGVSVPYQVDGDVVGALPVEVSVDPQSLKIRMPAAE
jgi:diacylglycerol kinase family enzyme